MTPLLLQLPAVLAPDRAASAARIPRRFASRAGARRTPVDRDGAW